MAEQRVRFEGVRATDAGVAVVFTVGDRAAKRLREVWVPYGALLDASVVVGINREASRRLKVLWEGRQDEIPWA